MLDEKVWIRYQALRAPRNEGLGSLAESEVIVHYFDKVTQYLLLKSFVAKRILNILPIFI